MTKTILTESKALRRECDPFVFNDGGVDFEGEHYDAPKLFDLLKTTLCENHGLGLAAPQLGIYTNVFVFGDPSAPESIIPVFNPRIVDPNPKDGDMYSNDKIDQVYMEEGCLSAP